jgi:hypothetical protein
MDQAYVPLTTQACADYMGFTPAFIRQAIDKGVLVDGGRVVKLMAETVPGSRRRTYRIHWDQLTTFMQAIGWQRLPARPPQREQLS